MKMLNGHYDGTKIVPDEAIPLVKGQRVMIYLLDEEKKTKEKKIDFSRYIEKGERAIEMDAQAFVNELRSNDRV